MLRHVPGRSSAGFAQAVCGLFLAALLAACQRDTPFTSLTPDKPVIQIAEGLTLSVSPAALPEGFGVQLQSAAAETFLAGGDGPWEAARGALPAALRPRGPVFAIQTSGPVPRQFFLSIVVPSGADPALLDLYAWDGRSWSFVPSHFSGGQMVASVSSAPGALGLFESAAPPPLAGLMLEPGQALTAEAAGVANAILLSGATLLADGRLGGQLPNAPGDPALALYPVVRSEDPAALAAILGDIPARANHAHTLAAFAAEGNYAGLALDYRGLTATQAPAFAQLVADAAAQLHAQDRQLLVLVVAPAPSADGFDTGGYDWRALGAAADSLLLSEPDDPAAYGDGRMEAMLAWASGEVSRGRLRLVTSALSVEGTAGQFRRIEPAQALAALGSVQVFSSTAFRPGQPITLTLSGEAKDLGYDPQAFASRYLYAGQTSVWLTSAETLRQRLALAEKFNLGGVVVADLLKPGILDGMPAAIAAYKASRGAAAPGPAGLVWNVSDASGPLAEATARPGGDYIYVAQAPGDYQFTASLDSGGARLPIGSAQVSVEAAATPTPTPRPRQQGGFVPPPPITAGSFELGGQVPGFISHAPQMRQAGMTWVKFQAIDPAGSIAAGKAAGFKVLISAVGDIRRAADPAYWPEYAAWVAGIAAMGADAIEIWNEANLDREWPHGQISGQAYTEMLKQAYTAIKAANPGTLVISGAPAPTGAAGSAGCTESYCNDDLFIAQMAQAGAASYMDCVGIHYNTGTTSPGATSGSALSGYHYSYYFWPMIDLYYNTFGGSRPLCLTELGYVSPEGYESIPLPAYFQWAAGTTVAAQAQWLAEAASLSASSGKVRMMIVFNVDFTHYLPNDPQAGYAIIRPDGSCPACAALDAVMP